MTSPTETITVAVVQANLSGSRETNIAALTERVREAASDGANLVLMPELFEGPYFPQAQRESAFALARPAANHPTLAHFAALAAELHIVLPVSFFERAGPHHYNSVATIDADGEIASIYRKSHIPDGPGYQEKYYFRPGDTGFFATATRVGPIGVAICWDQWFPEAARAMALDGADVLLYPSAIGSEPDHPGDDTRDRWQRVMIGHAVANACVVAAANRIGREDGLDFYGSSFIANHAGDKLAELDRDQPGVAIASIDVAALKRERASWGFFRDRRPDLYDSISRQTQPIKKG